MPKIWGERELIISISISLIWQSYFCIYFLQILMVCAITLVPESGKIESLLFIWLLKLVMLHIFPQATSRLIWCICNILYPTRLTNETLSCCQIQSPNRTQVVGFCVEHGFDSRVRDMQIHLFKFVISITA